MSLGPSKQNTCSRSSDKDTEVDEDLENVLQWGQISEQLGSVASFAAGSSSLLMLTLGGSRDPPSHWIPATHLGGLG